MLDAFKHCVLPFGVYVQTHEEQDKFMATRTIGAIALRPSENDQGGHYFMSLQSGRRMVRNRWTEVPFPADVIQRVNYMVDNSAFSQLIFGDHENTETHEDQESDESEEHALESEWDSEGGSDPGGENSQDDDQVIENEMIEQELDAPQDDDNSSTTVDHRSKSEPQIEQDEGARVRFSEEVECHKSPQNGDKSRARRTIKPHAVIETTDPDPAMTSETEDGSIEIGVDIPNLEDNTAPQTNTSGTKGMGSTENDGSISLETEFDTCYGVRSGQHNLRTRRNPRYDLSKCAQSSEETKGKTVDILLAKVDEDALASTFIMSQLAYISLSLEPLVQPVLTQYGIRTGLQVFGSEGEETVRRGLQQIHDRNVLRPRSGLPLTRTERREALQYLMFLKQKLHDTIRGRGCADGRKQRGYVTKEEASSPTIASERVFLIITIAAKEDSDIAIVDIPGAFMQTKIYGKIVLIRFEGRLAELLSMIDPSLYRQQIILEKGKSVLSAELQKVLYGILQAALQF